MWKLNELTYVKGLEKCVVHIKATDVILLVIILILDYGANVIIYHLLLMDPLFIVSLLGN